MLEGKQREGSLISVALIGTGWFGGGVLRELCRWPGIIPRLIITRTLSRAIENLKDAGVSGPGITEVSSSKEYKDALTKGKYSVSSNFELVHDLTGIDVVFEATGLVDIGARYALAVIEQGIHYVTANIEMDATVGYAIHKRAQEKGVIFTTCDGDQPGVLARMIAEIELYGFEIIVAGSCKGFLDVHQNPEGITRWVRFGHNLRKVTAFADGTKQSMELAILANGTNLVPDVRGMHGPTTSKESLVSDYLDIIITQGIVDYAFGLNHIDEGSGVFIIGKHEGKHVHYDLDYLKKGKGPYYLFFRDHHLCYYEAAKTIAEVHLFNSATLPHGKKQADVFAVAKKDLKEGEGLDGIGGFCAYGVIDKAHIISRENLLPVGLTEWAIMKKDVSQDTPITWDMVELEGADDLFALRKEEEKIAEVLQRSV